MPHPWPVDYRFLCELIERRISATGYRLRERGYVGEIERIYNNSVRVIQAINKFLELPADDVDGLLDAMVELNIHLKFYRYPVTFSRRFRDRLENHIGWKAELADARPPTDDERDIIHHLLEANFPGRDEIRRQLEEYLVKSIDEGGSLSLYPKRPNRLGADDSVPVWGEAPDDDGVTIYLRLHIVQGWLKELHVTKDDDSPVIRRPRASDLRVRRAG